MTKQEIINDHLFVVVSAAAPLVAFACAAHFAAELARTGAPAEELDSNAVFHLLGACYFLTMVGAATANLGSVAAKIENGESVSFKRRFIFLSLAAVGGLYMLSASFV